jgi:hypothetical protein
MEAKALFSVLAQRFSSMTLTGVPERYRHVQLNGLANLPLEFREGHVVPPRSAMATHSSEVVG